MRMNLERLTAAALLGATIVVVSTAFATAMSDARAQTAVVATAVVATEN